MLRLILAVRYSKKRIIQPYFKKKCQEVFFLRHLTFLKRALWHLLRKPRVSKISPQLPKIQNIIYKLSLLRNHSLTIIGLIGTNNFAVMNKQEFNTWTLLCNRRLGGHWVSPFDTSHSLYLINYCIIYEYTLFSGDFKFLCCLTLRSFYSKFIRKMSRNSWKSSRLTVNFSGETRSTGSERRLTILFGFIRKVVDWVMFVDEDLLGR